MRRSGLGGHGRQSIKCGAFRSTAAKRAQIGAPKARVSRLDACGPADRQDRRQRCARTSPERRTSGEAIMLEQIHSVHSHVIAAVLRIGGLEPAGAAEFSGRPGQGHRRRRLRRLPRHQPGARRLHAGRLEHAPAHDAELRARRLPPEDWPTVTAYLMKSLPGAAAAAGRDHRRPGAGLDQDVERADARLAPARSGRHQGRRDLVDRTARPTSSAGSIRRPARSGNTRSRRRTPGRTAWSRTRTATSGSPATTPR